MISFLLCLAILIVGYFVYGKIVDNTFGPDDRETPAVRINDGVDYVVMPQWKLFLVQLLNIAGLGPIFGAMQGALWGPVVFLWITFGTIFAGGVHDYFSGMMSERNDGASIAEITGKYLGPVMQNVMRVFSVVLLIMVGTVFAVGPAGLIVELCSQSGASGVLTSLLFWLIIILVYYFIATFISIDAVIGKIYPIFGICLIIMAVGVIVGIFTNPADTIPEIPVLGVGAFLGIGNALGFINYTVIWRYFSWTNQTLAMIVLWAASMYLFKEKKNFWITAVPATFMSAVSSTYFVLAPECLGGLLNSKTAEGATIYNTAVAYPVGVLFAVAMLAIFIHATKKSAAKA